MGQQIECRVRSGTQSGRGTALLESSEILFRGEFRLRIPLKDVSALEARDGRLRVEWPQGTATFELGAQAEKWAARIRNPRSLMDKLGVKAGSRIVTLGLRDDAPDARALLDELRARAGALAAADGAGHAGRENDLAFVGLSSRRDLPRLAAARAAIRSTGAVWAVWPKGRPELREDDVRAFARGHGLVDVKVARVSDSLSGLKLVIPVAERPPQPAPRRRRHEEPQP